jgi:hypothetical protein
MKDGIGTPSAMQWNYAMGGNLNTSYEKIITFRKITIL